MYFLSYKRNAIRKLLTKTCLFSYMIKIYLYFPSLWFANFSIVIGSFLCLTETPTKAAAASITFFIKASLWSRANKCWNIEKGLKMALIELGTFGKKKKTQQKTKKKNNWVEIFNRIRFWTITKLLWIFILSTYKYAYISLI